MTRRAKQETNTPRAQKDKTQQSLISHAQAARCNQDQDARRAAASGHTPRQPRPAQRRNAQSKEVTIITDSQLRNNQNISITE
jgi:hypothetical protein